VRRVSGKWEVVADKIFDCPCAKYECYRYKSVIERVEVPGGYLYRDYWLFHGLMCSEKLVFVACVRQGV
jgi:hypothetical protein